MLTTPFVSAAIVFTLLSLAWPLASGVHVLALATLSLAAIFAAFQAGDEGHYVWLGGFVVVAVLLNPVAPVPFPKYPQLLLQALSLVTLVGWLDVMNRLVPPQSISQVMYPREKH